MVDQTVPTVPTNGAAATVASVKPIQPNVNQTNFDAETASAARKFGSATVKWTVKMAPTRKTATPDQTRIAWMCVCQLNFIVVIWNVLKNRTNATERATVQMGPTKKTVRDQK